MDIVITTDSSCDLPLEYIEKNNVPVLGLICHIEGKEYVDDFGKTLTYDEFYKMIRRGAMPTTSQINVFRFEELFKKYVKENMAVIHISMSSKISGCYSSATIAKQSVEEEFKDADITVIDTKGACIGEGILVQGAMEMLSKGASKEEIVGWIEESKLKLHHWFIVEDLIHLKRGGRISATKANIGTLLQIKPMIYFDKEGNLQNIGSLRGRKKAIKALLNKFEETIENSEDKVVGISHGDCIEDALYLKEMILGNYKVKDIIINHVGPVIASHTGAGMLSVCFIGKDRVI